MSESQRHKLLKRKYAGPKGQIEKQISQHRSLDAKNPTTNTAVEIERSGNIKKALLRLKTQTNAKKKLVVPQKDLDRAAKVAKGVGINVVITNIASTKRRIVKKG